MRAIFSFTEELTNENQQSILIPHLTQIVEGLVHMITQNSTNQIGTLTMETLCTVLTVDEQFLDTVESKVSPLAIALFLKNTNGLLYLPILLISIKQIFHFVKHLIFKIPW
jgi:hypothetical protein